MSKSTPGPWSIKRDETRSERGAWVIEAHDYESEKKYNHRPWMRTVTEIRGFDKQEECDAHLIAAAPEMLDRLKRCAAEFRVIHKCTDRKENLGLISLGALHAAEQIESLIAKAEGRS